VVAAKSEPLKPVDVPVALRLAEKPEAKYSELAADLGISSSTAHAAVRRLQYAALLLPESRTVNWLLLREFLSHGLRYVFPARPGVRTRGVPTSHAGPPLRDHIRAAPDDVYVWPKPNGLGEGEAIAPLYPQAVELPERCPSLYELLTLADALRVGRVRERKLASYTLEARLGPKATRERGTAPGA